MERSERRGSLGRALEKLRTAMRRKGSSSKDTPTLASSATAQQSSGATSEAADTTMPGPGPSAIFIPAAVPDASTARPSTPNDLAPLVVDSGAAIDVDDSDEPLLPIFTTRVGLNEDRARELFDKYGLVYQPRRRTTEQEPPNKVRRVEKPVRIRVHWECHECHSNLARNRICGSCGHRRCTDCKRSPAKRVREIIESTKQLKEQEDQQRSAAGSTSAALAAPLAVDEQDKIASVPSPEHAVDQPLEKDDQPGKDDTALDHYKMVMQTRPRNGEDLILRPKTQIIRRSCHQCEKPFIPASRTECENCQHNRCTLCPRHPSKPEKWPMGSPGDEKAPEADPRMVRAVQRVYKRPRQRVRYTCERCQLTIVNPDGICDCGHARCGNCVRNP